MVTLREIPEGKPTITAAHNTSATSIYLAWKPPSRDTIHGEFLGYRIGYRRREKADEEMKNVYIRDPAVDWAETTGSRGRYDASEVVVLKFSAVQSRRDDFRRKIDDSSPNNSRNLMRPRCDSDNESIDVQCVVVRSALCGPLR
ncbi:Protein sidekick-2 [Trachymyrmex zeteki]|uniref:Protein sidekick-2 n=1 Tax=Mycetomoellerius zeteki TaxID=64791 RepID=A0A151WM44_9HYME|nr:Protein sidekick-2 [Trachymyrmex zeteki]